MNARDTVDLYSRRREEYVALRDRMRELRRDLKRYLEEGDTVAFRETRFFADTLARDLHRVQDSMWYLEREVCGILSDGRPDTAEDEI